MRWNHAQVRERVVDPIVTELPEAERMECGQKRDPSEDAIQGTGRGERSMSRIVPKDEKSRDVDS
jgi:hypothetical protein